MKARHLTPIRCLKGWDLPKTLHDQGGYRVQKNLVNRGKANVHGNDHSFISIKKHHFY